MNYSEITSLLGASMESLTDNDLRSLNSMIVKEINDRIAQTRLNIKRKLNPGARVIVDDPRCRGKVYTVESMSSKMAVLCEEGSETYHPKLGKIQNRIRASITLLKFAN